MKKIIFERELRRCDCMVDVVPIGSGPVRKRGWMNGVMNFFPFGSLNHKDPWWDILKLQGTVRITIETLPDGFEGP